MHFRSALPRALCAACALTAVQTVAACAASVTANESASTTDSLSLAGEHVLPPVVVTAPRMRVPLAENPAATTVVQQALATMPRTVAADEALKLVPGVKVDNQADGERVHMSSRGIGILTERGVRGIKVLLDDLPLNDPTGFAPDLFDVDWATVERIDVFRGPASALWGGGAAGGILDIRTRRGGPAPLGGRASFTGGSFGFWKALGEADGSAGSTDYRVSGSRTMADGYRDHTAFYATNVYSKLDWQLGERGTLRAIVAGTSFFNENAEGLNLTWLAQDRRQANPDALKYNEFQKTRRGTVGLTGKVAVVGEQDVSFSLYARHTHYDESVPSTVLHRTYDSPGGFAQYGIPLQTGPARHRFAVGVDLDGQVIGELRRPNLGGAAEGPEIVTDQTIRQRGFGAYLLDRIEFSSAWALMLGVRHDRIRNELDDHLMAGGTDLSGEASFDNTTGRVGICWYPRPAFSTYASWGQGFLPPATEELANNPDQLGGFNQHLDPATSQGGEVGARGALAGVSYDVAMFGLRTENDFGRYRVPARPLETFYENAGASDRYGVETLLKWLPLPAATLQLAYTYSHFKYDHANYNGQQYEGTWVPNSPEHQAFLDAEYRFAGHFLVGASGELLSRWVVDPSNTTSVAGYALLHARLAAHWQTGGRWVEAQISGRNVTGVEYIAFTEPDPDGNSYQPAPTAAVYGGVEVRF